MEKVESKLTPTELLKMQSNDRQGVQFELHKNVIKVILYQVLSCLLEKGYA